jgi:hypothetical protein
MERDDFERRCPRLGGDVTFAYCKACEDGKTPCFKVLDCWWERFDVVAHMKACLSPEVFDALAARRPPPDKVTSLVDLIRQARERAATP